MIAFLDTNIIAGRKLAGALALRRNDVARYAVRAIGQPRTHEDGESMLVLSPSWAGHLAWLAMPWALRSVRRDARARGSAVDALILSVPHYLPLAQLAARESAILYYCSDDFSGYDRWNAPRVLRDEAALCRMASLSIFVSDALRRRAIADYGVDPARTLVLPNASEARFTVAAATPPELAALPRPVLGAAGVFNRRIDFDFLAACAAHRAVGSLALVGPISPELDEDPAFRRLLATGKAHLFGRQDHADMHRWMAGFDVALIPYAATQFNHFCSPMRLYDHLAIGQPIVATPHCDQVASRTDVFGATMQTLTETIDRAIAAARDGRRPRLESWDDRADTLLRLAGALGSFTA